MKKIKSNNKNVTFRKDVLKKTTISCSDKTIQLLNQVIKKKIEFSIDDGTFDIMQLVKNKKGISYDKAIKWLCDFFVSFENEFNKASGKEKDILDKFNKRIKSKKMNSIA